MGKIQEPDHGVCPEHSSTEGEPRLVNFVQHRVFCRGGTTESLKSRRTVGCVGVTDNGERATGDSELGAH